MSSKPSNQKRRNNEKRKEKSRVAARCRRTKELEIFSELTAALPAKKEEVDALDKASVMRLAISYLRVRDVVSMLPQTESDQPVLKNPKGLEEVSSELSYMKALDGFVLVLSQQGDIVYCSENIADHLGVSQMEIMGQSVFEFSHPCDHDEVREALRSHGAGRRDLLLRLKCTLTSKGRNVHLKSASYKVIHVTGHMLAPSADKESKPAEIKSQTDIEEEKPDVEIDKNSIKTGSLVAVGRRIPHPSNIEIPLDSKTFLTKHSLDMKFTYTDESLMKTLGFDPDELKGRSLYDYHHAADSASLVHQFKSLFSKGQCETGQYRFLAKCGGFAWVQTQATVITDKQQKPISIVCVNYVISGIECKDEVFAAHQVPHADLKPKVGPVAPVPAQSPMQTGSPVDIPDGAIVAIIPPEEERPTPVTELIFAPRKEEMNKGFLMFSQDDSLTMLKDEPEDLTHLAPTAGDACIPLENSPFELFDEFLNDNYCSLLNDDLANGSPVESLPGDSLLMSSPEPHETDSSCERSSLLTDLSLDPFDSARSDNDIDDGNSPFIPNDDIPVLETAVMWGALPDNVSLAKPQPSDIQSTSPAPALQRLLAAPPTGPPPQDLITNLYDQGLLPSRSISSWETGVKRTIPKREEEPIAKRVKRSPSPPPTTTSSRPTSSPSKQSSSVLMNLLDKEQRLQQIRRKPPPEYQIKMQPQKPIPQNNNITSINSNKHIIVSNNNNNIFIDSSNIHKSNNAMNSSSNVIRNNNTANNNSSNFIRNNSSVNNNKVFQLNTPANSPNIRNNNFNNINSIMRNNNNLLGNSGGNIVNNNNNIRNNCPNNSKIQINNDNIPVNSINYRITNRIPMHYNKTPINNKIPLGSGDIIMINNNNIPIPVMNILQGMPKNQLLRPNTPNYDGPRTDLTNCMSPLNINVGNSVYSLPSSPSTSYSPIMSPSPRDHLSPYSTPQSMSPVGKYSQPYCPGSRLMSPVGGKCCDPYFSEKMQASPNYNFPLLKVDLLMPLSPEFSLSEMMQTNDLLTALDDVKLD